MAIFKKYDQVVDIVGRYNFYEVVDNLLAFCYTIFENNMNELVIPPSPNWYENKVFVCSNDNTLIYGSRGEIVIINPAPPEEPFPIKIISCAHNGRILSVDAHHAWNSDKKLIVSAGEDKLVKIWDVVEMVCLYENATHFSRVEKIVGSVFTFNNSAVSVSETGFTTVWNSETNKITTLKNMFSFKVEITTLSACPVLPWYVAFGSKCGLVLIIDIRKLGKLLFKIRGHDKSIVSLSWCPSAKPSIVNDEEVQDKNGKVDIKEGDAESQDASENIKTEEISVTESSKDCNTKLQGATDSLVLEWRKKDRDQERCVDPRSSHLSQLNGSDIDVRNLRIASSCKNGAIKIWCGGRQELAISIPYQKNKKHYRGFDNWIALHWIGTDILLSSSSTGELIEWTLNLSKKAGDPQRSKYRKRAVHNYHGGTIFAISAPWHLYSGQDKLYAWTIGQDRYILCCSLDPKDDVSISCPTIGGCIYCIASSPLIPTRLALGLGDNTAKIWDLSHPKSQRITMNNLWRSIQGKVFTLAWHPTNENQLAFGTHEGRIGLINANKPSSTPSLLFQHFRTAVHQVAWGPINGNKDNLGLYACGEGQVAIYNTAHALTEEPKIMEMQTKKYATCIAWKPDYTHFAIGFKSSELEIYNDSLIHKYTIFGEHKAIFSIVWHPDSTEEDNGRSPYHSWFAASTVDAFVCVYDLNCPTITDDVVEYDCTLMVELLGHSRPVTCICWSPYENWILASSGQDGIIQVWNVKTSTILGTYYGHNFEKILSVCWSPLKKNYLISGGKDNCIRIWDLTKQRPVTEEDLQRIHKEITKLKQNRNKLKQLDESDQETNKKVKRSAMLNLTSKVQNNPDAILDDCKRIFSSMIPRKEEVPENVQVEIKKTNNFDITKLFGDKSDILELLEMEQQKHVEKKNYTSHQHLALWRGNLAEALREAIDKRTVNPWLISMAPMVSPKLWQEACAAYTSKLLEDSKPDPFELTSYLLACHKVEEAVKVLCDETLFREALALAKCRLPKDHPLINEVISLWAKFAIVNGSFEIAAQCFIVLEQYEEAAKALFKRSDEKTLEFALELAEKTGNKSLKDAVTLRYNSFKNEEASQENEASNIVNDVDIKTVFNAEEVTINNAASNIVNDVDVKTVPDAEEVTINNAASNVVNDVNVKTTPDAEEVTINNAASNIVNDVDVKTVPDAEEVTINNAPSNIVIDVNLKTIPDAEEVTINNAASNTVNEVDVKTVPDAEEVTVNNAEVSSNNVVIEHL
ncbi:hypothetical protein Trydic_g447 [Trypoxylus dichotomus]